MTNLIVESNFSTIKTLTEGEGEAKKLYIEGVFAQHSVINRNRRIYPRDVLKESMDHYITEFVEKNRAVGEMEHPPTTKVNMDRIAIKIESLYEDGNAYIGKARVLNTPCGNILRGLLEGGVQVGVSTRADGQTRKNAQGIMEVQSGLKMSAIDCVTNPSAPDAFVDAMMESADWVWDTMNEDVQFVERLKEDIEKTNIRSLQEAKLQAFQKFMSRIREGV